MPTVDFLGHGISTDGIMPLPAKVAAVRDFLRPADVAGLQRFLGMQNYYHRFVPHAASLLQPLYAALKGSPAPKIVDWTPQRIAAFDAAKEALANATMLIKAG